MIILAVVVVIVAIVIVFAASTRRRSPKPDNVGQGNPAERIAQLTRLRDQGLVSDGEFESKRREILGQL